MQQTLRQADKPADEITVVLTFFKMALGFTVLIIDDDSDTLELLGEYLALAGFHAIGAPNGEEGLVRLAQERVDLVLLDIQMPKKDGFSTMTEIRKNSEWSDIPVIFLSSFDRPNLKVKGLELGAEDYVTKPFDRAELLARIKAVLRRSRRFREVENCLHGDLASIPLPVLLQTLALGSKSALIKLPELAARIYIKEGQYVSSEYGKFTGKDALLRLIFGARGKFDIEFDPTGVQSSDVPLPIDSLLIEFAPIIDETTAGISAIIDPEAQVEIRDGSALNGATTIIRRVIMQLPGDIHENSKHVVQAVAEGRITPLQ